MVFLLTPPILSSTRVVRNELTENSDSNNETDSTDSNNDNSDDKSDGKTVIPSSPETGDNLLAGAGVASVIAGAGLYISAKKKNKK